MGKNHRDTLLQLKLDIAKLGADGGILDSQVLIII